MKHWDSYQTWKTHRNPTRAELEPQHGYDTKHAMHLIRLMRMGLEVLETLGEAEFLLYQTEDERNRVEVRFGSETAWLMLTQMADLFQRDKSVISRHIKNVFEEGELTRETTVAEFATVQREEGREVARHVEYFHLDVVISVGYRVKSHRGTQFRIWATQRLREGTSFHPPSPTPVQSRSIRRST